MTDRTRIVRLIALCLLTAGLTGCPPEDSLDWSADGLVGLLRSGCALYVVDGQTGALTTVETEDVGIMPGISQDGRLLVYTKTRVFPSLDEGFRHLPGPVVSRIKRDAQLLRQKILAGLATLPKDNEGLFVEPYRWWVVRCMGADADPALTEKIGKEELAATQTHELRGSTLLLTSRMKLAEKQALVTLPTDIYRPRLSPDNRFVAYVAPATDNKEEAALLVASVGPGPRAVQAAAGVALGYDWRPDSKALAYIREEGDTLLAALEEKEIAGDDGGLLAQDVEVIEGPSLYTSTSPRKGRQLAGTLFQFTTQVAYGPGERLFFSSAAGSIPTTELDAPGYSLFCYDRVTGRLTDILPGAIRSQAGDAIHFFRPSPDGRRLLVPLRQNLFALYELGSNTALFPLPAEEGLGDENQLAFVPGWKGNDALTCLASEKSHFLVGPNHEPHRRQEILVLGVDGKLQKVLSKDWPDEAVPQVGQNQPDGR
jgi:hypothetical protein